MANTDYFGNTTKVHWAGAASATDIHLEIYHDEVDSRFAYESIFRQFSSQRSTEGNSQTYRIDRLGSGVVKGRTSGIALDPTRVVNDRVIFKVDTVLYIRNPVDYQDDWTAPDWLADIARNNAFEFSEAFDSAHMNFLLKQRSWVAPAHLVPSFNNGVEEAVTIKKGAGVTADMERDNATLIAMAHKRSVATLRKAKVPMTDMITLVDVDTFSTLLEHPKLLNADYVNHQNGSYAGRRLRMMNGVEILEVLCFPTVVATHPLGSAYSPVTADLDYKMITFSKTNCLLTIEAHALETRIWDDKQNMCNVLDAYCMYAVGLRRGDTMLPVKFTFTATP